MFKIGWFLIYLAHVLALESKIAMIFILTDWT
jgi:hypothetical protein